jgi:hypothetical protein
MALKKPARRKWKWTRQRRMAVAVGAVVLAAGVVVIKIWSDRYYISPPALQQQTVKSGPEAVKIVAVGDLSCETDNPEYNEGVGTSTSCQAKATSDLALSLHPDLVLTIGDEQYRNGRLAQFEDSYEKTWGRLKSITKPVPGNHEYGTFGAAGYFDYFGAVAGLPGAGYYSYNLGNWHIIALNSSCKNIGGCEETSLEETWLRQDLAKDKQKCTLAYWHQPRFSSGGHGSDKAYQAFWEDLQRHGADMVLSGHDHDYERFAPQDADGTADPKAPTEIVVGTGGESLTAFTSTRSNSVVRDNRDYGVLNLVLSKDSYSWQFITTAGEVKDAGTKSCDAKPTGPLSPTPLPTPEATPSQ